LFWVFTTRKPERGTPYSDHVAACSSFITTSSHQALFPASLPYRFGQQPEYFVPKAIVEASPAQSVLQPLYFFIEVPQIENPFRIGSIISHSKGVCFESRLEQQISCLNIPLLSFGSFSYMSG
jgi:hypothetical protein